MRRKRPQRVAEKPASVVTTPSDNFDMQQALQRGARKRARKWRIDFQLLPALLPLAEMLQSDDPPSRGRWRALRDMRRALLGMLYPDRTEFHPAAKLGRPHADDPAHIVVKIAREKYKASRHRWGEGEAAKDRACEDAIREREALGLPTPDFDTVRGRFDRSKARRRYE